MFKEVPATAIITMPMAKDDATPSTTFQDLGSSASD
jgi:hypothetical protein